MSIPYVNCTLPIEITNENAPSYSIRCDHNGLNFLRGNELLNDFDEFLAILNWTARITSLSFEDGKMNVFQLYEELKNWQNS